MRKGGIPLAEIKSARDYFAQALTTEYPFASQRFKADGKRIVLDYQQIEPKSGVGKLIYSDGQLGWKTLVDPLLKEFEYGDDGIALRWKVGGLKSKVLIDPRVSFGAPQVAGTATWVLRDRYLNGESVPDLADDFGIAQTLIVDALTFENVEVDLGRPKLWLN